MRSGCRIERAGGRGGSGVDPIREQWRAGVHKTPAGLRMAAAARSGPEFERIGKALATVARLAICRAVPHGEQAETLPDVAAGDETGAPALPCGHPELRAGDGLDGERSRRFP